MAGRRRNPSELPNAPLELMHPLLLPGAEIPGGDIVGELGGCHSATLLELLRAVLAWSAHPEHSPALDCAALERTEYALLSRGGDAFASPAGLLAGYMADPENACPREVAWACVCISDWAVEHGAPKTALQFATAAALAWPRHARYAWLVAKMLRTQSRLREAEAWFRRAHRIATWTDDWEAQARTLNSLGNLHFAVGRVAFAKRLNLRALRVATRHSQRTLEGEVCHDLFTIHAGAGDRENAEMFAAQAFTAYGVSHHNVPLLVHDIAQFWAEQGFYWRALPIFQALLHRHDLPNGGIREWAAASRVAGATGNRCLYDRYSARVWKLLPSVPGDVAAVALYLLGIGSEGLGEAARAAETLRRALTLSEETRSSEMTARCEAALARLSQAREPTTMERGHRELDHSHPGDLLAWQMAQGVAPNVRGAHLTEPGDSISASVIKPAALFSGDTVGDSHVRTHSGVP